MNLLLDNSFEGSVSVDRHGLVLHRWSELVLSAMMFSKGEQLSLNVCKVTLMERR